MTITNNEKIFQTASRNYNSSWDKNSKNLRKFPKNPANQSQYGYKNKKNWSIPEISQQQEFKTFKRKEILMVTSNNKNGIKSNLFRT